MSCSVKSCRNNRMKKIPGVSFHHFPSDDDQRNLWINLIGRSEDRSWNWHPGRYICSEHFNENDMNRVYLRPHIQKGAVPTLKISDQLIAENTTMNSKQNIFQKIVKDSGNTINISKSVSISVESDHGLYAKPVTTTDIQEKDNLDVTYSIIEYSDVASTTTMNDDSTLNEENSSGVTWSETHVKSLLDSPKYEQEISMNCQDMYKVQLVTYNDLNVMCRVCLGPGVLKPLASSEGLDCLKLIAPFDVNLEDKLPTNICEDCSRELTATCSFIRKYRESVESLRPIMVEFQKMGVFEDLSAQEHEKPSILEIATDEDPEMCEEETFYLQIESSESEESFTENFATAVESGKNSCNVEELPKQLKDAVTNEQFGIETWLLGEKYNNCEENYQIILKPPPEEGEQQKDKTGLSNVEDGDALMAERFTCASCGEITPNLITHYKQNKSCIPRTLKCKVCDKFFQNNSKLLYHMKVHEKGKPYECHLCHTKFKFMQNLRRHLLTGHFHKRRFKCEYCDKVYTTALVRDDHINTHTGARPFECTYCDATFNNRPARYKHMKKTHLCQDSSSDTSSEALTCGICNRVYASKSSLKNHLLTHTDTKDFLCFACGKSFRTAGALQVHSAIHTQVRRFNCPFCPKTFPFDSAVKAHIKVHTGERPFKCELCSKSFSQKPHLQTHELTHTGEKSNICQFCSKAFALKGNLVVHLRTHTGETPYTCHVCFKGFHDSSARKKHVRTYHGPEEVANIVPRQTNLITPSLMSPNP